MHGQNHIKFVYLFLKITINTRLSRRHKAIRCLLRRRPDRWS